MEEIKALLKEAGIEYLGRASLYGIREKIETSGLTEEQAKLLERLAKHIDEIDVPEEIKREPAYVSTTAKFSWDTKVKRLIITDEKAPDGVAVTDVSENGDGSVYKWSIDSDSYISTQDEGKVVAFKKCTSLFQGCIELTEIILDNADFSEVTDFSKMFSNCSKLKTVDLSKIDISSATTVAQMFYACNVIDELDLRTWKKNAITDFSQMFNLCYALKTVNVRGLIHGQEGFTVRDMFNGCYALAELDLSDWDVSGMASGGINYLFGSCTVLAAIYAQDWTKMSSNVTSCSNVFSNTKKLPGYNASYTSGDRAKPIADGGYFSDPIPGNDELDEQAPSFHMTTEVEPVETAFKEVYKALKGSAPGHIPGQGLYENVWLKFVMTPGENTTEAYDLSAGKDNTVLMAGRATGNEVIIEIYPSDPTSTVISKDHINLQMQVIHADRYDFENLRFRPDGILDLEGMFDKYYQNESGAQPRRIESYIREIKNLVFPDSVEVNLRSFLCNASLNQDLVIETENGGDIYPIGIHEAFYLPFSDSGHILDLTRLNFSCYDFYDLDDSETRMGAVVFDSLSKPEKLYAQQWTKQSKKIKEYKNDFFENGQTNDKYTSEYFNWREYGGFVDRPKRHAMEEYYNGYELTDQDVESLNFIKENIDNIRDLIPEVPGAIPDGTATTINLTNLDLYTQLAMNGKYGGSTAKIVPADANITFKVIAEKIGEVDSFDWGGTISKRYDISADKDNSAQYLIIDKDGNDMDFIVTSYPNGGNKLKLAEDALKGLFYHTATSKFTEIDLSGFDINSAVNTATGVLNINNTFRADNGEGRLKSLKGFDLNADKIYLTNLFNYQNDLEEVEIRIKDGAELMINSALYMCAKLKRFTIRSINGGDVFVSAEKDSSLYLANACNALKEVDISCLNMSKFDGSGYNCYVFYDCAALSKIYAQEWAEQNSFIKGAGAAFVKLSSQLTGWTSSKTGGEYAKWVENGGYFERPLTYEADPGEDLTLERLYEMIIELKEEVSKLA